ncbi:hypothetical protein Lesp02_21740 [Lentzea sp. NBRC 105346]|uniref:hypothetical protein n=1 Tax=Lentzea sp. NBRC 105346 TaxID=3032205 RepID=UPI0024A3264D|nr:hypothetical protein [Lentzea sp. NBRC 105346]GLZ29984.1 hypothetical protein Lesp02_21740 [Lentzea sp. NBRC 105346]
MRRALVAAACVLTLSGCGSKATPAQEVTATVPPTINKTNVDQARRDGAKSVTVMVSVKEGRHDDVVKALRELGASVEAQDPKIGYVRAEVPIEKADAVPGLPGVSKVDVDEPLSYRDPEP